MNHHSHTSAPEISILSRFPRAAAQVLRRVPFLRNVLTLTGGSVVAQVSAMVATPFVARLYSPSDYGVLGVYSSILSLAYVAAMLRYEFAVPIAKTDFSAMNLLALCFTLATVAATLGGAALWQFGSVFGVPVVLSRLAWVLPLGIMATCVYAALTNWSVRRRDYGLIARTKVTQTLGMITAQVGMGLARFGALGLILGYIVGQGGGIGSYFRRLFSRDASLLQSVSPRSVIAAASEYRRYPKYSVLAALLEAATSSMPYLFLSASYGPVVTGWYTLTERFVFAPVNMLSMSISQVLIGELAEYGRNRPETIRKVFSARLRYSAVLGSLVFLGAFFVLPPTMPVLFGQRWAPVSSCLRLMAPAYALAFIVNPYGCTVEVLQRQDLHLVRAIARLAFVGSAIIAARAMRVNWEVGIGLVSLATVMGMIVHLAISWYAVRPTPVRGESAEV